MTLTSVEGAQKALQRQGHGGEQVECQGWGRKEGGQGEWVMATEGRE